MVRLYISIRNPKFMNASKGLNEIAIVLCNLAIRLRKET